MEKTVSDILANLNAAQREAVVNYDKDSLIIAGAGSGKTRVLTCRIAYMLEQGVEPWRILALTFTNKAAREMQERIGQMVSPEQSRRLWMGTFHSLFLRILRAEAEHLGYASSFTIYDTADSRNLIKTIIKEKNLSDDSYKPNAIFSRISLAKNNLVTADAYAANATLVAEDRHRKMPEFAEIYKAYTARCKANSAMDFDDMLLNINILFRDFPEVLAKYQRHFAYMLVDEYQDTNYAQYIIIRKLAENGARVCVVGDDAQSIYSFRGAKVENILRFRNDFPQAATYKLEQNYRSTKTIVSAANSVIEKNRNRLDKESFSEGEEGAKIKVFKAYTDQEEASIVADEIRGRMRESGDDWSEAALLYRTNMQSRAFEEAFRRRGIPYRIYGGMSFYQRKEIKDMLAYLQLVVNPNDDESFKRIINFPARGIGDVTLGRIMAVAAAAGTSCMGVLTSGGTEAAGLSGATARKVADFRDMITSLAAMRSTLDIYRFGLETATRTGIIGHYKADRSPEAQSALENIEELLNSMQFFARSKEEDEQYDPMTGEPLPADNQPATIEEWLQSVTLLTDMDEDKDADRNKVTLMTIHAAKGLEFKYVFIVGLEENLFPSMMSMDGLEGLEEERRLFYVALTRAKHEAVLTFSETRYKWGSMQFCSPSRFLSEIDPKYLDLKFDPEKLSSGGDNPVERLKKQYGERDANNTVRGEAARRWQSPGAQHGGGRPSGYYGKQTVPSGYGNRPVSTEARVAGPDSRFRSVGVRQGAPAAAVPQAAAPAGGYACGMRVEHTKFGRGTIVDIEQMGGDTKISVEFDNAAFGRKSLLSKFAKLNIIG